MRVLASGRPNATRLSGGTSPQHQQEDHQVVCLPCLCEVVSAKKPRDDLPQCTGHSEPCVERTVNKDGPNKGKRFFACARPRQEQCNTFIWEDENTGLFIRSSNFECSIGQAPQSPAKKAKPAAELPKCAEHNEPCAERTVNKDGANKGRQFYVCARGRESQCKTFIWADEATVPASGSPAKPVGTCYKCGKPG